MIDTNPYEYVNPAQPLPRIISSKSLGQANIEQIKSYFTDEQVVRSIAGLTGMDFDTLVEGSIGSYWSRSVSLNFREP